ncbi:MAG: DUF4347 domain-containing protein [Methylococcaceae bacterium]
MSTSIVFIDTNISDYQSLIANLGDNIEIHLLNSNEDGLLQIANILQNRSDLSSIHIISHGSSGNLSLGSTQLDNQNLDNYSAALTTIRNVLTETGDILLYGCNVAQGDAGLQFINSLATATGADIAASTNLTGNRFLGGDWVLEQQTGSIETQVLSAVNYSDTLSLPKVSINAGVTPIEGGATGTFVINLDSPAPVGGLSIKYNLTASNATLNTDFNLTDGNNINLLSSNSFTVAEGQTQAIINANALADSVFDANETVKFNLIADSSYQLISDATHFTLSAPVPLGANSKTIVSADFNKDGNIDLATTNANNQVTVFLGNGSGGFTNSATIAVGANPLSLISTDFNNDGKLDLVTTNYNDNNISLLTGNGDGSFSATTFTPVALSNNPSTIVSGDFNGDNKTDFAIVCDSINLEICLGDGSTNFPVSSTISLGDVASSIITVDVNGDTKLDLITTNYNKHSVSVRLGNGDGSFGVSNSFTVANYPSGLISADFNGDGFLDLATANSSNNSVSILLGNGDGSFGTNTNIAVGNYPWSVVSADFNGDGFLDLATANNIAQTASTLLGDGKGNFTASNSFAVNNGVKTLTTADFNNDGKADLATANSSNINLTLLLNTTTASLSITDKTAPTAVDNTFTINEDTAYSFSSSDFGYADLNGDAFNSIKVISLPLAGSLKLNDANININQIISASDLNNLTFTPSTNANGSHYASFNFSVNDGTLDSVLTNNILFNVNALNDPPTGSLVISGEALQGHTLTAINSLADADGLGTMSYQWFADGLPISGETADTYNFASGDESKILTVTASYNDGAGNATTVSSSGFAVSTLASIPASSTGTINASAEQNWFETTLQAGTAYVIDLEGSATAKGTLNDPYFRGIYDSSGIALGYSDDDSGVGTNSQIVFTPTVTDNYYLLAGAWDTGSYQLSVSVLVDDYSANSSATGELFNSATGTINIASDQDWFSAYLVAGQTYQIDLEGLDTSKGTLSNPYFQGIYDSNSVFLDYNDDNSGIGNNAKSIFTPSVSGNYYFAVSSVNGDTGSYQLSLTNSDYPADTTTTGILSTVPSSTLANIDTSGDEDWFKVSLVANTSYVIDLEGSDTGKGTLSNPYFYGIYDSNALFLGYSNDNNGTNHNSRVVFIPTATGDYYLDAGASNGTGTYLLSVTPSDYAADISTVGLIDSIPNAVSSLIDTPFDEDWFKVNLTAGLTYQIDLESSATSKGTLSDPYFRGVYDNTGVFLGFDTDNGGIGGNAQITFTPDSTGTYYLDAGAVGTATGSYQLSVSIVVTDDYGADTNTTGLLSNSVLGNIETANDQDWFKVSLVAGVGYVINLEGSATSKGTLDDTYFRGIYDNAGAFLGFSNDDGGVGRNSQVLFTPSNSADYYLAAGAFGTNTGTYQLSVSPVVLVNDDYADNSSTTAIINNLPSAATGVIETAGDQDWFKVSLVAGINYTINLNSLPSGDATPSDPYFYGIYDSASNFLGYSDDDSGGNHNAQISFTPNATGDYYLAAGAFASNTGAYQLSVLSLLNDDYVSDTSTTGLLASVPSSVTGNIESAGDEDWFKVSLTAGINYVIDLEGAATAKGSLSDPYFKGIYDSAGLLLGYDNDDGGVGNNSRVIFAPSISADYYLAAGAYSTNIGNYQLSIATVFDDYAANTNTTAILTAPSVMAGTIEMPADQDWFKVSLVAGTTYVINLEGSATGKGSLVDPYFKGIYDSAGAFLGFSDDNSGTNGNAKVSFVPDHDGDYYLATAATGDITGSYQLSISANHPPSVSAPVTANLIEGQTLQSIDLLAGTTDSDADALNVIALTGENLLANSGAEDTIAINGWHVLSGATNWANWTTTAETHSGNKALISGAVWNSLDQQIDLVAKGYSPAYLDSSPSIDVGTFVRGFSGPTTYNDKYQMTVSLLDINHQLIASYDTGIQTTTAAWLNVNHRFVNYGTGVRYISFIEGGRDGSNLPWSDNYGTIFDDAYLNLSTSNLLNNSGAQTGDLSDWTVTNAGSGWAVTSNSYNGGRAFISSNGLATLSQDIDLVAKGYSSSYLDNSPSIDVGMFVKGSGSNTADSYQLMVSLLDVNHQIISSYDTALQTSTADWLNVSHQFSDYGTGVRYLRFSQSGRDAESLAGSYGAIFDDAYVNVSTPNLLANAGSETLDTSSWTVSNGGSGWAITSDAHSGGNAFISSYELGTLSQDIDLVAKGYTNNFLDSTPSIDVGTFVKGYANGGSGSGGDYADTYRLTVSLLNVNHQVMTTYDSGLQTASDTWRNVAHHFSDYGTGVRYVRFSISGQDAENWLGNNGAIFDDSYINLPIPNLITNPSFETGSIIPSTLANNNLGGWTVTDGGSGWATTTQMTHSDGHAFISSYELGTLSQDIDLVAKGYTPDYLDTAPTIDIGTFVKGYAYSFDVNLEDKYRVVASLLDADHKVIATYDTGLKTYDLATAVSNYLPWLEIAHSFSDYGAGVRYVRFAQSGQDAEHRIGNYGALFDDAYVRLPSRLPAATNLIDNTLNINLADPAYENLASGQTQDISVPYTITDGQANVSQTATISITGVNDAPSVANKKVVISGQNSYTFSSNDFSFTDTDSPANNLLTVILTNLPTTGSLQLDGNAVSVNQVISASAIDAGLLKFISTTSYNDFSFKVQDDGGTDNNGIDTSNTAHFEILVTGADRPNINDAPLIIDSAVTASNGMAYYFKTSDFNFVDADNPANNLLNIIITSLPSAGQLRWNNADCYSGQSISITTEPSSAQDIINWLNWRISALQFIPDANANGSNYASFNFKVQDDGGIDNGGIDTSAISGTMQINVDDYHAASDTIAYMTMTPSGLSEHMTGSDTGTIETAFDQDWFVVYLYADASYTINLKGSSTADGTLGNPYFRGIYDDTANFLGYSDDNSGVDGNAQIVFKPKVSGIYFLAAGAADTDTGTYQLSVTGVWTNTTPISADDYSSDSNTTGEIASIPNSITGIVDNSFDTDWFRVFLAEGITYTIDLEGEPTGKGTLNDPYFYGVYKSTGAVNTPIANTISDNGGIGDNAQIIFTPTSTGIYYLIAGAYQQNTGSYQLSISGSAPTPPLPHDDYAADTTTTALIATVPSSVTGAIELTNDQDWFKVHLVAGTVYNINVTGSTIHNNALNNVAFYGIYDQAGAFVSYGDSNTSIAQASFTATLTDDYYLIVGASGTDTGDYQLSVATITINNPPSSSNTSVTTLEDNSYTFTLNDFAFSDTDNNQLATIILNNLPTAGSLQLNSATLTAPQTISASDINNGLLTFIPANNANNNNYANFNFNVQDDGGTLNAGIDTSINANTITINVTAVNDAPTSANRSISTLANNTYTFNNNDFGFSDSDGNSLANIIVTSLPLVGLLQLNGTTLNAVTSISVTALNNGLLKFIPATNASGNNYASFDFKVQDNGGTLNGGSDTSTNISNLTINVLQNAQLSGNINKPQNDVLIGTSGNDPMYGYAQNDKLSGNDGNDSLWGGYGNDTLNGGTDDDLLLGDAGRDSLIGGEGNDTLDGGAGIDTLSGGAGDDTYLLGYYDRDSIIDRGLITDSDTVIVPYQVNNYTLPTSIENGTIPAGIHTYTGLSLYGSINALSNTLNGNANNNVLTGNEGNNALNGYTGNDTLIANAGNDSLAGGYASDSLVGGLGNDLLNGGLGNDTLTGGLGEDRFLFTNYPVNNIVNIDKITDFNISDDTIVFNHVCFSKLAAGVMDSHHFRVATTAVDNNDYIIYNPTTGALFYDTDGNHARLAIQIATLGTGLALTNSDFMVI